MRRLYRMIACSEKGDGCNYNGALIWEDNIASSVHETEPVSEAEVIVLRLEGKLKEKMWDYEGRAWT